MPENHYDYIFRGLLTEQALDKAGRPKRTRFSDADDSKTAERLGLPLLNSEMTKKARRMATVYTAICAFENQVRDFVRGVLLDKFDEKWWGKGVPEKVRTIAESRKTREGKIKWLSPRGDNLLGYIEFGDLAKIMRANFQLFEPHITTIEWADQLLGILEESRNVIMHGGELSNQDIERIGVNIRDWIAQAGI